jgi:hypothetical protein
MTTASLDSDTRVARGEALVGEVMRVGSSESQTAVGSAALG